jgi:carbon storage regulator
VLVLARRIGEKLVIGDNVTVSILGFKGDQVHISIADVKDNREEIHQLCLKEQAALRGIG